jgi:hypothetical protein
MNFVRQPFLVLLLMGELVEHFRCIYQRRALECLLSAKRPGVGLPMSRSAIAIAYGSLGGLVDEFWPDITQALFKRDK